MYQPSCMKDKEIFDQLPVLIIPLFSGLDSQ